jgi:hypothetical protein
LLLVEVPLHQVGRIYLCHLSPCSTYYPPVPDHPCGLKRFSLPPPHFTIASALSPIGCSSPDP